MSLKKYKLAALAGTIVMGFGAFMACLCTTQPLIIAGDVLLGASILIMTYGYSGWQP